jgi:hypothetical protein
MTKYTAILILTLVILGCQSSRSLTGSYSSKNTLVTHSLELNADSTFYYTLNGGLLEQNSRGVWSITDLGDVVLNSDSSYMSGIIKITGQNTTDEYLRFRITDKIGNPLSYAAVILNNNEQALGFSLDKNGEGKVDLIDLESIQINYLGEIYKHTVTNKSNHLQIRIRLKDNTKVYFRNEIWKVRRKRLINTAKIILMQ